MKSVETETSGRSRGGTRLLGRWCVELAEEPVEYMVDYIYCSIGTFLSKRTMTESKGGRLGRNLLSIMKGSVVQECLIPKGDHTIKRGMGMAHDYKEKL